MEAIDVANADDPVTVDVDGNALPREVFHAQRMTHWLGVVAPHADAAQRLAARAHHLRRWTLPRSDYPTGRAGYLRWRAAQKQRHVTALGEVLRRVGVDDNTIDRVGTIVAKVGLGQDPAVQAHEDALCLVFLEQQYDELTDQLGDDHMIDVLRRTLAKMSPVGLEAAVGMNLSERGRALLVAARSTES